MCALLYVITFLSASALLLAVMLLFRISFNSLTVLLSLDDSDPNIHNNHMYIYEQHMERMSYNYLVQNISCSSYIIYNDMAIFTLFTVTCIECKRPSNILMEHNTFKQTL